MEGINIAPETTCFSFIINHWPQKILWLSDFTKNSTFYEQLRSLQLLFPDCVHYSSCSLIASASAVALRLHLLQLLPQDCARLQSRTCSTKISMYKACTSLVQSNLASFPGPREGEEKGPSFHCFCMCSIALKFHQHCRPSIYVCTLMTWKQTFKVTWSIHLHMYHSTKYSIHEKRSWSCSPKCHPAARHSWSDT